MKYLAYFGTGLFIAQLINLFGNIVRIVPEWEAIANVILYGLVAIALIIGIINQSFFIAQKTNLGVCILIWFSSILIPVFYALCFDLAKLDVILNNVSTTN
jgi:hypothetical protein